MLGAGDKTASDNMYAILGDILRKANTGHTIGNAIVAECVRTITAIYPNPALLQAGAHLLLTFSARMPVCPYTISHHHRVL